MGVLRARNAREGRQCSVSLLLHTFILASLERLSSPFVWIGSFIALSCPFLAAPSSCFFFFFWGLSSTCSFPLIEDSHSDCRLTCKGFTITRRGLLLRVSFPFKALPCWIPVTLSSKYFVPFSSSPPLQTTHTHSFTLVYNVRSTSPAGDDKSNRRDRGRTRDSSKTLLQRVNQTKKKRKNRGIPDDASFRELLDPSFWAGGDYRNFFSAMLAINLRVVVRREREMTPLRVFTSCSFFSFF